MARTRKALTRERIVAAALEVIDAEGADRLTIRRVAAALGCAPMALYNHVADKDALLDAVAQHIFRGLTIPPEEVPAPDRVRLAARQMREAALAHPNALPVLLTRRLSGPQVTGFLDALLGALDACAAPGRRVLVGFRMVISLAIGSVLADPAGPFGAMPDRESAEAAIGAKAALPHLRAAAKDAGTMSADDEFEAGLDLFMAAWTRA